MAEKQTSVIVLAAGKSTRMGESKMFLNFTDKKTNGKTISKTFIEHLISLYKNFGVHEIILVINKKDYKKIIEFRNIISLFQIRLLLNEYTYLGRLYSIQLGLLGLLKKNNYCYIQDVDRPFINENILNALYEIRREDGYASLKYQNKSGHPVLIGKNIIDYIIRLKSNPYTLSGVLNLFPKNERSTQEKGVSININYKTDYLNHFH